jgi:hypothetical protein
VFLLEVEHLSVLDECPREDRLIHQLAPPDLMAQGMVAAVL